MDRVSFWLYQFMIMLHGISLFLYQELQSKNVFRTNQKFP